MAIQIRTIVIDGNDGVGKTSVVKELSSRGCRVFDRGLPTQLTDNPSMQYHEESDVSYFILDCSVDTSRKRLAKRGADLNEKYHTVEDLTLYRERFLEVAKKLPNCYVINAERKVETIVAEIQEKMK